MHTHAHAYMLGLCAWGVRECTLPAESSASPSSKLHAEIPSFCSFSCMLRGMHGPWGWGGGNPVVQRLCPGGWSKGSETQNLPSLRPGQVGSLNLAGRIAEESPEEARLCCLPAHSAGTPRAPAPHWECRGVIPPQFHRSEPRVCRLSEGERVPGASLEVAKRSGSRSGPKSTVRFSS